MEYTKINNCVTKDKATGAVKIDSFANKRNDNVMKDREMANSKGVTNRKEAQLERLRTKYPDKKFEDEEEIYGQISDDYDQYENELSGYKEREKALSDMFAADPRSAQFLTDMHKGKDPVLGLVRNFGIEIKDVLDDPEMQGEIAEANKEFVERVAKSKELDAEYERNLDVTLEELRKYQEENNLSDEQIDDIMEFLLGVVRDGVMGKFSAESLELANKALNYDDDVALAGEEGEVAGRNAKITEQLRKRKQGDGTMPLGGKNGEAGGGRRKKNIFDLAGEAM